MAKYVIQRIIFAQNGKNLLRNINDSLKTTGNKAQAIKFMMLALDIKFSHCEYIKNDSSPMSICCLEEYIWPNM